MSSETGKLRHVKKTDKGMSTAAARGLLARTGSTRVASDVTPRVADVYEQELRDIFERAAEIVDMKGRKTMTTRDVQYVLSCQSSGEGIAGYE